MTTFEFLGPYRVGRLIGRGGMGAVYEGVHERSGEKVAVKLISGAVADEIKFRRRFAGEVETLKRLRHNNIVRLIGYGEEQGHLFYSMELVEGESLQQRIRRRKRLDWLPATEIAIQVCGALKHAHDLGVIHRDLKPANLLLTADDTVKLVDFGIAKLFGAGEHTAAGSVLGTADYMAPEQASGGPITQRTDLYALGSVMYAMLTGRPPFSGKRITEVIESLRRDRVVPLDLVNPELPEEIVAIVHELLSKDPQQRPPTALAVLNRLKATKTGLQRGLTREIGSSPTLVRDDEAADRGSGGVTDRGSGVVAEDTGRIDPATDPDQMPASPESPPGQAPRVGRTPLTDAKGPESHEDITRDSDSDPTRPHPAVEGFPSPGRDSAGSVHRASPEDATIASEFPGQGSGIAITSAAGQSRKGEPDADEFELAPAVKSHYRDVDPSERDHSLFHDPSDQGPSWAQKLSIAGMIVVLVIGVGVIAYAFQKPTADELWTRIAAADEADQLSSAKPLIQRFLKLYPEDPRVSQVEMLADSLDAERTFRRLRTEADRAGGAERLLPMKQSFLQAMDAVRREPQRAKQLLDAWLAVYAPPGEPRAPEVGSMETMVRRQLERLRSDETTVGPDPRLQALEERIRRGREPLSVEDRRKMLRGIVTLFSDQAWARPVIEQIERELENGP